MTCHPFLIRTSCSSRIKYYFYIEYRCQDHCLTSGLLPDTFLKPRVTTRCWRRRTRSRTPTARSRTSRSTSTTASPGLFSSRASPTATSARASPSVSTPGTRSPRRARRHQVSAVQALQGLVTGFCPYRGSCRKVRH